MHFHVEVFLCKSSEEDQSHIYIYIYINYDVYVFCKDFVDFGVKI
jgi:hypothetical protein